MQRAAVRKLEHELGIPRSQVPLEDFRYLTRLHYSAADTDTYGPTAEWGEHEVISLLHAHSHTLLPQSDGLHIPTLRTSGLTSHSSAVFL